MERRADSGFGIWDFGLRIGSAESREERKSEVGILRQEAWGIAKRAERK
jgi:hypothetical protein